MKKLALIPLLTLFALVQANAAGENWLTDYAAAVEKAKQDDKFVLMDFTGSDWCPPCIQLQKRVFSKPEFKAFAEKHLVLLTVDFPNEKKLSPEQEKANEKLAAKYKARALPTIILLNSEGKEAHRTEGYGGEPADKYVANLQKIIDKN